MQRIKFIAATGLLMLTLLMGGLFTVEHFLSARLIPRNFEYLQLRTGVLPFGLRAEFTNPTYRIHDGRRELAPRGERGFRIAFVGDSVTFGLGVNDGENFVERIQKAQTTFDAYNYGVPGYGLPEILATTESLNPLELRRVVYTLNFNDIYSAMPGLLGLLDEPQRFARTHGYEGSERYTKLFLKEHFKSYFLISQWIEALRAPTSAPSPRSAGVDAPLTAEEVGRMAQRPEFQKYSALAQKFWSDPQEVAAFKAMLLALKRSIHGRGSELWVTVFYDFNLVEQSPLHRQIGSVLEEVGLTHLDAYPLHVAHRNEPGFYADPGHPGPRGHQLLSEYLLQELEKVTGSRIVLTPKVPSPVLAN